MKQYKSYTIINNEVINIQADEGGLDIYELGVYIYALKSQNNPNFMFSIEKICKHFGAGEIVISRAVKSLEAKGILKREFYKDDKGYRRAFYRVADTLTPCDNDFVNDEEMLVVSMDAPAPNENYKPQITQQNIPQEKPQLPPQEKPKSTSGHIQQVVKSQEEIIQEQIKEKARFIYDNFNVNDSLDYDKWLDWARYKQSVNKLDIVALELVLKQSMNMLNSYKERANEAIEYSIGGGYKGLFLPKIDESKKGDEPKGDEAVKRAGITIPIKYHLLNKKSELYGIEYISFLDYIVSCDKIENLTPLFKIKEGETKEVEVREHINDIIRERAKFLKKQKE